MRYALLLIVAVVAVAVTGCGTRGQPSASAPTELLVLPTAGQTQGYRCACTPIEVRQGDNVAKVMQLPPAP